MKKGILVFIFFVLQQLILCQTSEYTAQPDIIFKKNNNSRNTIRIDLCRNEASIFFYITRDWEKKLALQLHQSNYSYKINIWRIQEIRLKKIDKYRLLILNNTVFFKKGEILYCHNITDCKYNNLEVGMLWKNGKRDGCWQQYTEKGIIYTEWKNGKKNKVYFKTYKEVKDQSKRFPPM